MTVKTIDPKPPLFSEGFKLCDALLIVLCGGLPFGVYVVTQGTADTFTYGLMLIALIAVAALCRVKIAFAALSVPFFGWALYTAYKGFILVPDYSELFNPVYVGGYVVSVVIEGAIGMYFFEKSDLADV